jgi:hypothetical protein
MDADAAQPTPYQLETLQRLRILVSTWLIQIRETRIIFAQSPIPNLHLNYPLPEDFPLGEFTIEELFRWVDPYGHLQIKHSYRAYFRFHGFPAEPWFPLAWSIISGTSKYFCRSKTPSYSGFVGYVFVGFFELDARIFHDPGSPLRVDADLILGGMIESIRSESKIRLRSRIERTYGDNASMNVETFELRTFQGRLIMDIGQRLIPQRHCSCGQWLPPVGPNYCLENLACQRR